MPEIGIMQNKERYIATNSHDEGWTSEPEEWEIAHIYVTDGQFS